MSHHRDDVKRALTVNLTRREAGQLMRELKHNEWSGALRRTIAWQFSLPDPEHCAYVSRRAANGAR